MSFEIIVSAYDATRALFRTPGTSVLRVGSVLPTPGAFFLVHHCSQETCFLDVRRACVRDSVAMERGNNNLFFTEPGLEDFRDLEIDPSGIKKIEKEVAIDWDDLPDDPTERRKIYAQKRGQRLKN